MKLTKQKLISFLKPALTNMGYSEFKDSSTGSQGLYVKKINGMYLCLGTIISRYEDAQFSASFYLSKTTRWGSIWDDIPRNSYQRISFFLKEGERELLLNEDDHKGFDAWWDASDESNISNFLKVVEITESRFINQNTLIDEINRSKEVIRLSNLVKDTIAAIKSGKIGNNFDFLPNKEIDEVPMIWFKAAELTLKKNQEVLNKNLVKLLATDSWRQFKLNN